MPLKKEQLIEQLEHLHTNAVLLEEKFAPVTQQTHEAFRKSAQNLLHYLSLRQHDIRKLQEQLSELGLSSLGRAEGHVLASLQAVYNQLCHRQHRQTQTWKVPFSFAESKVLLNEHTQALLGPMPAQRNTRIIVTASTEFAGNYKLVCRLLKAGMNCVRINCAHDEEGTWKNMIRNIRQAEQELHIPCRILMDLMGPKLRTGPLQPGPRLLLIHPVQDMLGKISAPAKVWLAAPGMPPPPTADAALPVAAEWLAQLQIGDELFFKDTRGRRRTLTVIEKEANGLIAHLFKISYISTGTRIRLKDSSSTEQATTVGDLPPLELAIVLRKGDFLELTHEPVPGEPAQYNAAGQVIKPAHISCTLSEAFTQTSAGEPILFDDGKIEGVIEKVTEKVILVKITYANKNGSKLTTDKGINLPESRLRISGLTEKDKQDLVFVARYADIVSLSFVNDTATVEAVQAELTKLGAKQVALMLKIETKEGFRNLPHLLLAAMKSYPAGVMIARGDLAVECGWQELAEVQEEILWLCEAAHIPVVWATQVLENLAKKGRPSRAEITDAAMAQRADCVMLNKGPFVLQAVEMLHEILIRMQEHQHKKTSILGSLPVSWL